MMHGTPLIIDSLQRCRMASAFALLAQFLATVMIAALLDCATYPVSRHCVPSAI